MTIPERTLNHIINVGEQLISVSKKQIVDDDYETGDLPNILNNIADSYRRKGQSHALLEEETQARKAYSQAAKYNWEHIQAVREHKDTLSDDQWEDATLAFNQAMVFGVVARDLELARDIAAEAIGLDESYLTVFADREATPLRYYNTKVLAATILNDERWDEFHTALSEAIEEVVPLSGSPHGESFPELNATTYKMIHRGDTEWTIERLEEFLSRYERTASKTTDDPDELVNNELTGLCLLANDSGIDVTIDNPHVPAVLVPDPATAEYVIEGESGA